MKPPYSHCHEQLHGAVEIIPDRLYYAALKFFPPENEEDESSSDCTNTNTYNNTNNNNSNSNNTNKNTNNTNNKPDQLENTKVTYNCNINGTLPRKRDIHYFCIDNTLLYWNFFLDFGPFNLGQLYRFCSLLNHKLITPDLKDSILCFYSSEKGQQRANAVFLIAAWTMLYLGRTLDEAYFGFREHESLLPPPSENASLPPPLFRNNQDNITTNDATSNEPLSPFVKIHPLPPFHDASPVACTYDLTVYDCLCGLDQARRLGFFCFSDMTPPKSVRTTMAYRHGPSSTTTFDIDEYEYFEQVENGDLNWIVQNKILAFAGPQSHKVFSPEGYCVLTPSDYLPYFQKQTVKLVIRLNKKCYDEKEFERVGIRHVEHYYLDGSCPEMRVLQLVLKDMESIREGEAMAIHCKAGLGRTGTCIGAYLMKHYGLTAKEAIGWMRICRPGMVIGPQQQFLQEIEPIMWQEGQVYRSSLVKNSTLMTALDGERDASAEKERIEREEKFPLHVGHPSIMVTPQQNKGMLHRHSLNSHVKIVTPDTGFSKYRERNSESSAEDDLMTTLTHCGNSRILPPTPSSSTASLLTMDNLEVQDKDGRAPTQKSSSGSRKPAEGDQANALLSRKVRQSLNQYLG